MKKAIWGYNIHEVDESIDYLEAQNIKLEKQVRQLSEDLEKARAETSLSVDSSDGEDKTGVENEKLIDGLRAELESVKLAYAQSEKERENLAGEIARRDSKSAERGEMFSEVGNICRLAYEDMHNTKRKAKENIEEFLREFWNEWQRYQQQVCDLSEQIKRRQQESRNLFIESADQILHIYGSMKQNSQEFDVGFSEIMSSKGSLQSKLEELLDGLDEDVRAESEESLAAEEAAAGSPEPQKNEEAYSILRTIKAVHENKTYSETDGSACGMMAEAAGGKTGEPEPDVSRISHKSETVWSSVKAAAKEAETAGNRGDVTKNEVGTSGNGSEGVGNGADCTKTNGQKKDGTFHQDEIKEDFSISPGVNVRNII